MEIILPETELFEGIDEAGRRALLDCLGAVAAEYRKGEPILTEGSVTRALGLVLSGLVLITHADAWGSESVLGHAGPGSVFAEAYACIPGEPLLIRVTAAEDARVLFIDAGRLLEPCAAACGRHKRVIQNLLGICARKSLQLSRKILHTGPKTIRGRLMSYFSDCAGQAGGSSFTLPYRRQQLADYLGVDRSAMCAELSKMRRDGLIEYDKNRVTLKI